MPEKLVAITNSASVSQDIIDATTLGTYNIENNNSSYYKISTTKKITLSVLVIGVTGKKVAFRGTFDVLLSM